MIWFKLLLLFINSSFADCNRGELRITNINPVVVNFTNTSSQNVNFQVQHPPFTGTEDCEYVGVITYGSASSYTSRLLTDSLTSNSLTFNTYKNSPPSTANIIRDHYDANNSNEVIYFPIFTPSPSTQTNTHTFLAQIDPVPPSLPPGLYTEALVLKIVARPPGETSTSYADWPVVSESAIQFQYNKERILNLSVVSSGASHNSADTSELLSFGPLKTGKSLAADITIETNVGYRLLLSSSNDGQLMHESSNFKVPYSFNLDGSSVDLSSSSTSPVVASSNASNSPSGGFRLPANITLGNVSGNEPAGRYSDIITATIEAF